MFGYVRIRKPELKVKDYELYRGVYCGLCSGLKRKYGFLGQVTLTYDMTFLILLLSSVYDIPMKKRMERCLVHPGKKHLCLENEVTDYVVHLNLLLAYYHFQDDSRDEKSKKAWLGEKLYYSKKKRAAEKALEKQKDMEEWLFALSELERQQEKDIDKLADCFGQLLAGLFDYKRDGMSGYLKKLGYHLGRFIYIMDAYDDLAEDEKSGCFNPFLANSGRKDFDKWVEGMLLDEMAEAGAAFQMLPCLEYTDILGNILYAGVWNRYDEMHMVQEEKK